MNQGRPGQREQPAGKAADEEVLRDVAGTVGLDGEPGVAPLGTLQLREAEQPLGRDHDGGGGQIAHGTQADDEHPLDRPEDAAALELLLVGGGRHPDGVEEEADHDVDGRQLGHDHADRDHHLGHRPVGRDGAVEGGRPQREPVHGLDPEHGDQRAGRDRSEGEAAGRSAPPTMPRVEGAVGGDHPRGEQRSEEHEQQEPPARARAQGEDADQQHQPPCPEARRAP
ncbi:hypothetical protein [Nocardioides ungokensis]|uniref:hypothetical protein n=1 Tax=Nocardioides ungokensis TaxID=1643322 RepID=UPI0015DE0366|nr:hypothetical protein [Nocardioides ungokensis]